MPIAFSKPLGIWHRVDRLRAAIIAVFCPCAALVVVRFAAVLTEGDPPQTAVEWLVSILGNTLVLPAVAVARAVDVDTHPVLFWSAWALSGVFWAIVVESVIILKNAWRP
jgi:hypothetical protein